VYRVLATGRRAYYRTLETMVTDETAVKRPINWLNMLFILGTLLVALVATPWYLIKVGLGRPEATTFVVIWLLVGLSVTAGYHRLFSHKTYQAAWPVRLFLLIFGAGALENSVLNWCADHRIHHAHVDHDRDPYNITKGFWWAHMGWIFFQNEPIPRSVVRDLEEDPLVRWQAKYYALIGLSVALGIPLVVGLLTGRLLGCFLIGGVLRIVVSHHGTFFINSLCHMVGSRPYSQEHSARDSPIMAVLAFGEGYHNYHHSFPFDYRNGVKVWQFDPAKWMIWTLARLGLARDLRRAPEAAVLKAKVEVQFNHAQERLQQVVHDFREHHETRLHEAYASLQTALHELISLQRRQKPKAVTEVAAMDEENLPHETRVGLTYRALEQALGEWKRTLRQTNRLPVAA
jgi:stearoyl-CoA desaturase (delta-9 desaturase)